MKRKTNIKKSIVIFAVLVIFFSSVIFFSGAINAQDKTQDDKGKSDSDANIEEEYEVIDGVAENFKQDEKNGIILFWGSVKITRENGYLNADKVTIYRDIETDDVIKTVAEGNVEMKDGDLFATCDHAVLYEADDIIELTGSVVVTQKEDKVEAPYIKYNRKTGIREGKGNNEEVVQFRVRLKKKEKSESESSEESSEDKGEN